MSCSRFWDLPWSLPLPRTLHLLKFPNSAPLGSCLQQPRHHRQPQHCRLSPGSPARSLWTWDGAGCNKPPELRHLKKSRKVPRDEPQKRFGEVRRRDQTSLPPPINRPFAEMLLGLLSRNLPWLFADDLVPVFAKPTTLQKSGFCLRLRNI